MANIWMVIGKCHKGKFLKVKNKSWQKFKNLESLHRSVSYQHWRCEFVTKKRDITMMKIPPEFLNELPPEGGVPPVTRRASLESPRPGFKVIESIENWISVIQLKLLILLNRWISLIQLKHQISLIQLIKSLIQNIFDCVGWNIEIFWFSLNIFLWLSWNFSEIQNWNWNV